MISQCTPQARLSNFKCPPGISIFYPSIPKQEQEHRIGISTFVACITYYALGVSLKDTSCLIAVFRISAQDLGAS